jgi:uncharacterized protein
MKQVFEYEEVDIIHKVLILKIQKSIEERGIYNATRFSWRLKKEKAIEAEYVLAVSKGIIKGVFIAEEWNPATKEYFPDIHEEVIGRYAFKGKEAEPKIFQYYINKKVPYKYRRQGPANPVFYSY